jgi:iron complex transport system substrate-binding protein
LTVFYLSNPTDMDGLYTLLITAGELSGHKDRAESLSAALRERVTAVEAILAAVETPVTVFYELDGSDPAKPWTVGPGTFIDLLITWRAVRMSAQRLNSPGASSAWKPSWSPTRT